MLYLYDHSHIIDHILCAAIYDKPYIDTCIRLKRLVYMTLQWIIFVQYMCNHKLFKIIYESAYMGIFAHMSARIWFADTLLHIYYLYMSHIHIHATISMTHIWFMQLAYVSQLNHIPAGIWSTYMIKLHYHMYVNSQSYVHAYDSILYVCILFITGMILIYEYSHIFWDIK